ncbi:MAG: hypothetical protein HS113_08260 [Verrucomicrobiales bacterium]|nr:hypothetical protein [Verrucomicrobiales bacterium]
MLSETFRTYGQAEPPAELIALRTGPLTVLYDPTTGFVRRIQCGEREVLRGIYAAVRDHNWDTIPATLRGTKREIGAESFQIEFESEHRRRDVHFVWRGSIRGGSDGVLRYGLDGEARTTFQRNRIGFCVLHPIRECAGAAARQTRTDGRVVACRFPDIIERQIFGQNSFHDLRALSHEVAPGCWAEVEFEGEVFELEDQRNWTDASFKTYGTPLARPFPVEVPAGTQIRQQVTLRLRGTPPAVPGRPVVAGRSSVAMLALTVPNEGQVPLPHLGLGIASHGEPLSERELGRLRTLRLSHLRLDLHLGSPAWPDQWERAARQTQQLGVALELALHLPRSGEVDLGELRRLVQRGAVPLARVLALREGEAATTPGTLRLAREAVGKLPVPVGAGSDANFCEVNREQALGHLALAEADFVFWSLNPQVHAFDHLSLVETLEAQPETVKTARAFAGGKSLVISPVTLKQRFNPVARGAPPPVPPGQLPPPVDPRQLSLFGAAWTLGSLAALSHAGAASLTCYETTGWRGLMETETGSPLPERFPSQPGEVFPLFHVFAALAGLRPMVAVTSDRVGGAGLFQSSGERRLLLANLDPRSTGDPPLTAARRPGRACSMRRA